MQLYSYNSVLSFRTTSLALCSNNNWNWKCMEQQYIIYFSKDEQIYNTCHKLYNYCVHSEPIIIMSLLYGGCTAPYEVPLPAMSDTLSSYSSGLRSRSGIGNVGELHSEPKFLRYHLEVWPTIVCLLTAPYR